MINTESRLREAVIATCLELERQGIIQGTSGNVSVRWREGLLITPSGRPYARLTPADIVLLSANGAHDPQQRPSSEWRIHRDILQHRPEVGAVVHTHSIHATALAMRGVEIPAAHYMVAAAGGANIRCAPYATFGTQALSDHAVEALRGRKACLLANHGVIAVGPGRDQAALDQAAGLAGAVEVLAQQYILSQMLGGPKLLPQDEIDRVVARFADYGRDV